jgi:protein-S-isoprenylcysteine O-methyltransferase Ste14
MKRVLVFLYGVIAYVFFLGVFLYAVGFVGNIWVPESIDSTAADPVGKSLLINALILGLFALQHSLMPRSSFKAWITRYIPEPAERSTYVLLTNITFVLIFWQWRPLNGTIWQLEGAGGMVLQALFWLGWGIVLISTFLVDHFELFGLKQVTRYLQKRDFHPPAFVERSLYKHIRHPIMLGFVIAFWATSHMSMGHLFFAILTTGYIFVGIAFEERDLLKLHGETYKQYARRVPMLIPFMKFGRPAEGGNPDSK